jgi:hypothetical protein
MTKVLLACSTLLLASCGFVTSQSIYEGIRTQQSANGAGKQPAEKMDPYDAYEKERAKIMSPERRD